MLPVIFGLSGPALTADERDFFRDAAPLGFILFGRNCQSPGQLRALTDDLRSLSGGGDLPILVDQEGGAVARLGPPAWPSFPAPERFARLYEKAPISAIEAARVNAQAMALVLAEAGVTVACTPVLDLRLAETHEVIGDRALGSYPMQVAALGRAVLDGLGAGGVAGVLKHLPGHGRARVDSHRERPVVEAPEDALEADLAPFRALGSAPFGMVAHIVYAAWDGEACASQSHLVIDRIVRGRIGFEGFLISDDIAMAALQGPMAARAAAVVGAGCDAALHCSGDLEEMERIAGALCPAGPETQRRLERAMAWPSARPEGDYHALAAKRDALLALA